MIQPRDFTDVILLFAPVDNHTIFLLAKVKIPAVDGRLQGLSMDFTFGLLVKYEPGLCRKVTQTNDPQHFSNIMYATGGAVCKAICIP